MFPLVSLFCRMLLLSQLLFCPEVLAGDHLTDARGLPPAARRGACAWGLADALRPHCALSVLLVQLCEAAPRSCVSQLIRLQCKLSVSGCDTLRGFMTRAPSTPAASPQVICFRGQCRASRLRGDGGRASRRPRSCSRASNSELSSPTPLFPPGLCPLVCRLSMCHRSGVRSTSASPEVTAAAVSLWSREVVLVRGSLWTFTGPSVPPLLCLGTGCTCNLQEVLV